MISENKVELLFLVKNKAISYKVCFLIYYNYNYCCYYPQFSDKIDIFPPFLILPMKSLLFLFKKMEEFIFRTLIFKLKSKTFENCLL